MRDPAPAVMGLAAVAIDSTDPERLCRWWQGLIGGRVVVDDDGWVVLRDPEGNELCLLRPTR